MVLVLTSEQWKQRVVLERQRWSLALVAMVVKSLVQLPDGLLKQVRVQALYVYVLMVVSHMIATLWQAHRLAWPQQVPTGYEQALLVSKLGQMMKRSKHGLPLFGALLVAACAGGGHGGRTFVSLAQCRTTTQQAQRYGCYLFRESPQQAGARQGDQVRLLRLYWRQVPPLRGGVKRRLGTPSLQVF